MGLIELIFGGVRKAFGQGGLYGIGPESIHNRLVREDRIRLRRCWKYQGECDDNPYVA
jgi:hypothetical protein